MADEILTGLLLICFAATLYIAGKGNMLELVPKMLLERLEEINKKHGEWIEKQIPLNWCEDDVDIVYECSICGCKNFGESPYCPNCGAKMDGEDIDVATKTDRVEVVRCRQCRHATDDIIVEGVCYCHKIQQGMFLDGFCSYGERRKE